MFADDASDGTQIGISPPTLITYSDRSKVVITGDLTRDELVKVAESMKVYGDESRPLHAGLQTELSRTEVRRIPGAPSRVY